MPTPSFRRTLALLLLVFIFAAPWTASAAGLRAESPPLDFLGRLWSYLTNLWSEEGCRIDPNGLCATHSSAPVSTEQVDSGCMIDPDGRCAHSVAPVLDQMDEGCRIDPDGRCSS
jgi:hypothetical protein